MRKQQEDASNVYNLPSIAQTIKYLHAAVGYPVEDTWINAINAGNYTTWPGITAAAVGKHFPKSDEMQKGQMKQQRQGVRSTKALETIPEDRAVEAHNSPTPPRPKKMKDVYIKIHSASKSMYTDQPGRFPPSHIQQRKSVHNGVSRSRWKIHRRRANEEQIGRIDDKSLPCIMGTTNGNRSYPTHNASHGQ